MTFGTTTHARAALIKPFTCVIAPRYTSVFRKACFMPSLTETPRMGMVVCPPMMSWISLLPSFKPLNMGALFGICTLPITLPFAPMPRYRVSLLLLAPPNAPISIEESITSISMALFGRLRLSCSEPEK